MRNKNGRRRASHADGGSSWISYSDMMAALVLLFVLVLSVSMFYHNTEIETKTAELDRQTQLLASQQILLDTQTDELNAAQATLAQQQSDLDAAALVLATKEDELTAANLALNSKQAELDAASLALASQQALVASQQEKLEAQQLKLDALVGVRTSIVKDLTSALAAAKVKASVDPNTGDIVLESNVFFGYGKNEITEEGKEFLRSFVPVYLGVLLKEEYSDYLGEVIIEGHTDTTGTYTYNLELSQKRALAVAKFCLEIEGLTSQQKELLRSIMTVTGKSYSNPVLNADGTVNAEASRRVEFKFGLRDTDMIDEIRTILSADGQ